MHSINEKKTRWHRETREREIANEGKKMKEKDIKNSQRKRDRDRASNKK